MTLPKSVACTHPDHTLEGDCLETGVGCSPFCECCLDPFSVHTNKMQARIDELESVVNSAWHALDYSIRHHASKVMETEKECILHQANFDAHKLLNQVRNR